MEQDVTTRLAGFLAEAFETGNPLAPLPPELTPGGLEAAGEVAGAVLEALGIAPNGLRLAPGPDGTMLAGPMLEARLLPSATPLALSTLRHARLSPAAVGVLAEALEPEADAPPRLAAVHPAIDIAASRFRDGPASAAEAMADLAGLGLVVAGKAARWDGAPVSLACGPAEARLRGTPCDLAAAFAAAAAEARRWGGLPAGALLVVAGLAPAVTPADGEAWAARLGPLGRAEIRFAA